MSNRSQCLQGRLLVENIKVEYHPHAIPSFLEPTVFSIMFQYTNKGICWMKQNCSKATIGIKLTILSQLSQPKQNKKDMKCIFAFLQSSKSNKGSLFVENLTSKITMRRVNESNTHLHTIMIFDVRFLTYNLQGVQ